MKKALITIFTLIILFAAVSYDSYAAHFISDPTIEFTSIDQLIEHFRNSTYNELSFIALNYDNNQNLRLFLSFRPFPEPQKVFINKTYTSTYETSTEPLGSNVFTITINNFENKELSYSAGGSGSFFLKRIDNTITPTWINTHIYGTDKTTIFYNSNTELPYYDMFNNFLLYGSYDKPGPESIPLPNEYLYITLPREGYKTIDKFMTYNVMYSIAADQVSDVTISPKDITGDPFSNNTNIKSFDVVNHTATIENGYLKGTLQLLVDYNSTFVGPIGTQIKVTNTLTNRELSIARNAEIVAFVDADGDGIDDNTGQDQYQNLNEEFILITKPGLNSKTSTKLVPLNFAVKIKANDYQAVEQSIKILYLNPVTNEYESLLSSEIMSDWNDVGNSRNQLIPLGFFQYGEYLTMNSTVNLLFKPDFVGKVPIRIEVTSNTTNKVITKNHIFEVVAFVDANGDGIDDNTWEQYNPNPTLPDISDNELTLNDSIDTLKGLIPSISESLTTITTLVALIFGWLPPPVLSLIFTIIILIGITTLLKVIRG